MHQSVSVFFYFSFSIFQNFFFGAEYASILFVLITGKVSFNNRSLHHIGDAPNPYEKAISIVGKTLAPFDDDNLIPCFGFGDGKQALISHPHFWIWPSICLISSRWLDELVRNCILQLPLMIKKCLAFTTINHLAMDLKKYWHATEELFRTYGWQVGFQSCMPFGSLYQFKIDFLWSYTSLCFINRNYQIFSNHVPIMLFVCQTSLITASRIINVVFKGPLLLPR